MTSAKKDSARGDCFGNDGSPDRAGRHDGVLFAVGVGPGDPELVTLKALRVLEACPVIAAARSREGVATALDIVRGVMPLEEKRVVYLSFAMSRDPEVLQTSHAEIAEAIAAELAEGRDVAMPILGDVSIYSTFHHVKPLVEGMGYRTQVIPGVPSFCAVAAELGQNLTPTMETPLHVLPAGYVDVRGALGLPGTKVFMKAGRSLGDLKAAVQERCAEACSGGPFTGVVRDCGLPTQRVYRSLDEAPDGGGYFTTAVVGPWDR